MWPKRFALVFIACAAIAALTAPRAQILNPGVDSLDPVTQRALDELNRLTLLGTPEEVMDQLRMVVNSSGYIPQLAPVYYRLAAQSDDANAAAANYFTVIDKWAKSAWAQKSLNELVPLILMSETVVGGDYIRSIWGWQEELIAQAEDAPRIGEDPRILSMESYLSLVYLAHQQSDLGRLDLLARSPLSTETAIQDIIGLARISAAIGAGRNPEATQRVQEWLAKNPNSSLRPYAYILLYEAASDETLRAEAIQRIREDYPQTLEAALLGRDLSARRF